MDDWDAAKAIGGVVGALTLGIPFVMRMVSKNHRNITYENADSSFVERMQLDNKNMREEVDSMRKQLTAMWDAKVVDSQEKERLSSSNERLMGELARIKERMAIVEALLASANDEIERLRKRP